MANRHFMVIIARYYRNLPPRIRVWFWGGVGGHRPSTEDRNVPKQEQRQVYQGAQGHAHYPSALRRGRRRGGGGGGGGRGFAR